jgi:hypothetical protein
MKSAKQPPPPTPTLIPQAGPSDGTPGWKILLPSRQAAEAVAAHESGEVQPAEGDQWPVIIRHPDLTVRLIEADEVTLKCLLPAHYHWLAVTRRAWGELETLACPDGLPAHGMLTVRQFIVENPVGQILAFCVPVFTATDPAVIRDAWLAKMTKDDWREIARLRRIARARIAARHAEGTMT